MKSCIICGINVKGFIYYEYQDRCICRFCFKGLVEKGSNE